MKEQIELDFVRGKQLAREIGISEKTVYNWNKKGIIRKYGVMGCVFYRRSEVLDALIHLKPNSFKKIN